MVNFNCLRCGKAFKGDSHWKTRPPKFCSRYCVNEHFIESGHMSKMSGSVKTRKCKVSIDKLSSIVSLLEGNVKLSIDEAVKGIGLSADWGRQRLKKFVGDEKYRTLLRRPKLYRIDKRGNFAEQRIANLLRKDAWSVYRSAGSRGLYDLIAYKSNELLFIKVKRTLHPCSLRHLISNKELCKIKEDEIPYGRKEIWIWEDGHNHRKVKIQKHIV